MDKEIYLKTTSNPHWDTYVKGTQMDIEIIRPKQYQDRIRNYKLVIDGVETTIIKPNSKTRITLPDDAEYLQGKIDWCTSPKFYVRDIKSSQVSIKNSFGGNWFTAILLPLYYITFGKGKYLKIESGS